MHFFWKLFAAGSLALAGASVQAEFVSVAGTQVNIRQGPSNKTEITWELSKGYPMKVTKKQGNWLKVKDFDGDLGWVYKPLTQKTAHHIVKTPFANMRKGPGQQHEKVGELKQYDLFQTLEKKDGWVKGRSSEGQTGWISQKLLWGW